MVQAAPSVLSHARSLSPGRRIVYLDAQKSRQVNNYPLIHMRDAWRAAGVQVINRPLRNSPPGIFMCKCMMKLGMLRNFRQRGSVAYVVPLLYLAEYLTFPVCYFSEVVPYSYDCWPKRWDEWEAFYRRHQIKVAFISAQQSVREMQRRVPETDFVWMPEAVDADDHIPDAPLKDRSIDVLELGRRYDLFHGKIVDGLAAAGKQHLYFQGQLVFPTREELSRGMGQSRISVCFPATITHPDYAGGVETATLRYFQSIASKSILLGHAPKELVDLFGYNPVVQANLSDPLGQILDILAHIEDFQSLVDRNYRRLLEVGTWHSRVAMMLKELRERGYDVP